MQRALIAGLFVTLALVFAGCAANLEKAVIGKYRGEIDISGVDAKNKQVAEMGAAMMKGITFEIKEGGKAAVSGVPDEAKWTLEGTKMTVTPTKGEKLIFTVEEGGKKLVPELTKDQNKMLEGAKIWFKKE